MATTSDIRNGMCIEYNNDIYVIVEFQHVKPGKGNAFVRTKLKSMTSGRTNENTWVAGHTLNEVRVERRKFQYLYKDEMGYNFMNTETFDQISVPDKMIENGEFLKELPPHVYLAVTYTEPGVKGNTATNALKMATLETGAVIKVPMFINEGDLLKVDTRTSEYLERAK